MSGEKCKILMVGVLLLAFANSGCASQAFKKASAESATGKINEVGVIISQGKFMPETLETEPNETVRLWIVNMDKAPVQVSLASNTALAAALKFKQIGKIDLPNPTAESYELQVASKSGEMVKASLKITKQLQNRSVVIVQDFQAFMPIRNRVLAETPLTVYLASVAWAPHSDFEIYGTDIKLPFKNGTVSSFEIKDGLKPGAYAVSRPGYPNQNHGIKSMISVEPQSAK